MAYLTQVSDYIGLYTPEDFGVSTQAELNTIIQNAIERAHLDLLRYVPESTYNDAAAAIAADAATDDQIALRWSEYWFTRYELELARRADTNIEERAGSLMVRKDSGVLADAIRRFLASAFRYLRTAGFEATGGDLIAGVRGGDPLPDAEPWFGG